MTNVLETYPLRLNAPEVRAALAALSTIYRRAEIEKVVEVISQGAAGSWQMANRHKTMDQGHFEHGFAVDWMRKDLAICLAAADEVGASLPVTALVDQFYKDVQRMGGGRWDTSSLIARLG